jgi:GNAT superfamily N-acetyltransferase
MHPLPITEVPGLDPADLLRVYAGLGATDPPDVGPRDYASLALVARGADGALAGALSGATIWGWLQVDALWVAEPLRRAGLGGRLLAAAEEAARRRGCTRARLDTFDFQARAFYERRGYEVYARLDGFPAGHTQFHLHKPLAGAPAAVPA